MAGYLATLKNEDLYNISIVLVFIGLLIFDDFILNLVIPNGTKMKRNTQLAEIMGHHNAFHGSVVSELSCCHLGNVLFVIWRDDTSPFR